MIRTKDFVQNAFQSEGLSDGVRIYVQDGKHGRELRSMQATLAKYKATGAPSRKITKQAAKVVKAQKREPTYKELAGYQLDAGGAKFFPETIDEVNGLDAVGEGWAIVLDEANRQLEQAAALTIQGELNAF
jgi:hypothetical protein